MCVVERRHFESTVVVLVVSSWDKSAFICISWWKFNFFCWSRTNESRVESAGTEIELGSRQKRKEKMSCTKSDKKGTEHQPNRRADNKKNIKLSAGDCTQCGKWLRYIMSIICIRSINCATCIELQICAFNPHLLYHTHPLYSSHKVCDVYLPVTKRCGCVFETGRLLA